VVAAFFEHEYAGMQYYTAFSLSSCSDLNCVRSLPLEMLANLDQADQNASYPGLETVVMSSGMYRWRTSLSLGIF
jgi:hypothetical protein